MSNDTREQIDDEFAFAGTARERDDPAKAESIMRASTHECHLRREPRDTTLSLWSQHFAHADMAFAYDFGDISAYMEGYDALMQHWKKVLRIPICELDYETLVTDT